jgi:simple sugar transport system permease protein
VIRLALRGRTPRWLPVLLALMPIVLTYLLTAGPIRAAGANPMAAYERYVVRPLSTPASLMEVLLTATPLLFTGLAVALAFRCGYWNIGADGQFLTGAIAATFFGLHVRGLPPVLAIVLVVLAGAVAGLLWALVPALLRTKFGIDEVVTTLLLNPVALLLVQGLLNGPWRNPENQFPESAPIDAAYTFPRLVEGYRLHLGFAVALGLAVVLAVLVTLTPVGLRMRAVGRSADAARFAGVRVERTMLGAALGSGAIAGVGGVSQVCGLQGQLTGGISDGFGYTGVVVATLAGLSVLGVALVSVLLADIVVGAESAVRVLQVPPQMGDVVTATLMLTVVAVLVLRRYRLVVRLPGFLRRPTARQEEQA